MINNVPPSLPFNGSIPINDLLAGYDLDLLWQDALLEIDDEVHGSFTIENFWGIGSILDGVHYNLYLGIDGLELDSSEIIAGEITFLGITLDDGPLDDSDDFEPDWVKVSGLNIELSEYFPSTNLASNNIDNTAFNNAVFGGDNTVSLSSKDDVFNGGAGNNVIYGGDGNDKLYGGSGDDTLSGGAGKDTLDGGAGFDVLFSANIDVRQAGVIIDTASGIMQDGLGGTDTIANFEAYIGTTFADQFFGKDTDTDISIELNAVNGDSQNYEIFKADGGDDVIDGRGGYDEVTFNSSSVGLIIDLMQSKQSDGTGGTDTISNIEGVEATDYNDTIYGTDGANCLDGRLGNNIIDGRDGYDFVEYNGSGRHNVNADLSTGIASFTGGAGGASYVDMLLNIEGVIGSSDDDTIIGDERNNKLYGGYGDDYLEDGMGSDEVYGGAGNDTINNTGGSDLFDGGDGKDTLITDISSGFEERSFEVGFNTVAGTHGRLNSTVGQDTISSIENFTLLGNFNAVVTGGDEDNTFKTGAGDDVLTGGGGDDTLSAWMGNDKLSGNNGNDTLEGGNGKDKLYGGSGNDTLEGGKGKDILEGGKGKDTLEGGKGKDILEGGKGKDTLEGGKGKDTLEGGKGKDIIFGGSSADTFVFTKTSDSKVKASKADVIKDFEQGKDHIDLSAIDASTKIGGNNAFTFDGTTSFGTSNEGDVYYETFNNSGTANDYTMVYIDTDNDRGTEMSIKLMGLHNLTADDFIL